jgi:hypothetical protein
MILQKSLNLHYLQLCCDPLYPIESKVFFSNRPA